MTHTRVPVCHYFQAQTPPAAPQEVILDLALIAHTSDIENQLVDFGVVGPGPRRALNFVQNRRWWENLSVATGTVCDPYNHRGVLG